MQRRRYRTIQARCILGGKGGCLAIIVASKSPFALRGITDARWIEGEILRDLGMTRANLTDTQSKYTCTGLYLEQQETRRNGRSCGYVYTITQPLLAGRERKRERERERQGERELTRATSNGTGSLVSTRAFL